MGNTGNLVKACQVCKLWLKLLLLAGCGVSLADAAPRKYALLVGIAEYTHARRLPGTINDVSRMEGLLTGPQFGFAKNDLTVLRNGQATRQGILDALENLRRKARPGDVVLFYYAGHGTLWPDVYSVRQDETVPQTVNQSARTFLPGILRASPARKRKAMLGKKADGTPDLSQEQYWDAALCPFDHYAATSGETWGNLILDDELNDIFARFSEVYLTFIADACHSGTLARTSLAKGVATRWIPLKAAWEGRLDTGIKPAPVGSGPALGPRFAALTAARDDQPALESEDSQRQVCGLFSHGLYQTLTQGGARLSYRALLDKVRLAVGQAQEPQLIVFEEATRASPFLWPGK